MNQAKYLHRKWITNGEIRKQLGRDVLAAWAYYQATGLHVSAAEADAWLAKLEIGERASVPECHNQSA